MARELYPRPMNVEEAKSILEDCLSRWELIDCKQLAPGQWDLYIAAYQTMVKERVAYAKRTGDNTGLDRLTKYACETRVAG